MVNTAGIRVAGWWLPRWLLPRWLLVVPLAALLLTATACLRGAEYDEQYTLFLTAGTARPVWPDGVFPASLVQSVQTGSASLAGIGDDLRATDVHPPLYFWVLRAWRSLTGPTLLSARLLSVVCGVVSVALLGLTARALGLPPLPPALLLLGCYGFVYTNAIARNFGLAEVLALGGVLLVLRRRAILGGALLGAACACNYLAVFAAAAVIVVTPAWAAVLSMLPFLGLDAFYFLAQHAARPDQFPPFALLPSLARLAKYQMGSIFGGLPLYAEGTSRIAVSVIVVLVGGVAVVAARPWRAGRILVAAALAPAAGLLALGAIFNNTPIELRYLCFSLPFIALLLGRRGLSRPVLAVLLLQSVGIAGLLMATGTMQPARVTAQQAAALAQDGVVLLPTGNDGVGIVGAFGIEAPPGLKLLLVHAQDTPASLAARLGAAQRVVLALMAQDSESVAAVALMRSTMAASPDWRRVAISPNVEAYERTQRGG